MADKKQQTCALCGLPTKPWEGGIHQECESEEFARSAWAESGIVGEPAEQRGSYDYTPRNPLHPRNVA